VDTNTNQPLFEKKIRKRLQCEPRKKNRMSASHLVGMSEFRIRKRRLILFSRHRIPALSHQKIHCKEKNYPACGELIEPKDPENRTSFHPDVRVDSPAWRPIDKLLFPSRLRQQPNIPLKSKCEFCTLRSDICVCVHTNFENFKDFLS
jgi:hypothetical protein